MVDTRTREQRRRIMQSVGQKNTGPEMAVRRLAHRLGFRYRLYRRDLPGSPDLTFPARRKVIFVHGCFWHGHGCQKGRLPKSRRDYWQPKINSNQERDSQAIEKLIAAGWEVLVVWQCETRDPVALAARLRNFLRIPGKSDRQSRSVALNSN
ncbi:MAG TPA: very short patch repair endonuclease [Xanthobacteraceae bacterium]|jgi:DNA mismatch endonuclease (patch repair protein)